MLLFILWHEKSCFDSFRHQFQFFVENTTRKVEKGSKRDEVTSLSTLLLVTFHDPTE